MISKNANFDRISTLYMALATLLGLIAAPATAAEGDYEQAIRDQVLPQVRQFIADRRIVDAVRAQNARHALLSQDKIDEMDKRWRAETTTGGGKLIGNVLGNDLSAYLSEVQQNGQGLYTEIFVMDNKGLNVGQSGLTTDYWQGDEAKWQQTYSKGPGAILIDDVEFDESTQTFQSQLSLPVVDSITGEAIGAVTVGVNMDLLQ